VELWQGQSMLNDVKLTIMGSLTKYLTLVLPEKELKVVFFDCDWFDSKNGTRKNQFGVVEVKHNEWLRGYDTFILAHQVEQVYYLSYPCQKLNAWWVVHKLNPRERLHTPGDVGYHDTPTLDDDVDEVYQEEELQPSFIVDPGARLDDLVGDDDDIEMSVAVKRKQKPIKKMFGCLDQGLDYQIVMLVNFETIYKY
jgi:hypothetical protein